MATLKAAIIPVTPLQQNSCVIWKESSKIAAVTDPGGDLSLIENFLSEQGLSLSKVFITHGHLDHAGGAFELAQKYNIEISEFLTMSYITVRYLVRVYCIVL